MCSRTGERPREELHGAQERPAVRAARQHERETSNEPAWKAELRVAAKVPNSEAPPGRAQLLANCPCGEQPTPPWAGARL